MPEKIKSGIAKGLRGLKTLPFIKNKNKRVLLFLLCGLSAALLIAAAAIGISIYSEGQTADEEARKLLMEYEQASASYEFTVLADDAYVQPKKPDVKPANTFSAVKTLSGYQVIGKLTIQKISVVLPVISHLDEKALKVSVCYYEGALPGEAGNMVIAGHNYANGAHFGKLDELKEGDVVIFEAPDGSSYRYEVYDSLFIKPDNMETLEEYEAQSELTLLTCASQGNRRLLVRCKMDNE